MKALAKIVHGTVIDHIPSSVLKDVVNLLHIWNQDCPLYIASNLPSRKIGSKGIVKLEGVELQEEIIQHIALLAPQATLNLVKDSELSLKKSLEIPDLIEGFLHCPNMACVQNQLKGIKTKFYVKSQTHERYLECYFCERTFSLEDFYMKSSS